MLKPFLFVPAVLCIAAFSYSQSLLSPVDLRIPVQLSGAEISPDGSRALLIVTRSDYENNTFCSELLLLNLQTGQQSTLTTRKGISEPSWSPDGDRISFLAEAEDQLQIFLIDLKDKKEEQITRAKGGILHHTWSPDGTRFAFLAVQPKPEKTGTDKFNDAFEAGSHDYLTSKAADENYAGIIQIDTKQVRQVSPDGKIVATDFYNSSLSWTPDGKKIAVSLYPASRSGDSDLGKIHLLDVETGNLTALSSHQGQEGPGFISPDGRNVAFFYPRDGVPANVTEVYSVSINGGPARSVTRNLDRETFDFAWLSDDRLLLTGYDGPESAAWVCNSKSPCKPLDLGEVVELYEFSVNNNDSFLYIGDETYRPSELYFKKTLDAKPVRITDFNREIASRKQGKREVFRWKSTGDLEPDGILTYPPDFNASRKYPLVLLIHGGPTGASTSAFSMTAQMMAAKGWIVFEPNYRGSNHLGNKFQSAIANDAGEGPGQDVITGVQELKKKPYVDAKRIAVSGWSYGGWMTAWLIGRYPDEWVAAVAGAAPVDYTDMYSLSDLNRMRRHAITDSPYKGKNYESALSQSPIQHFSKIKTPTLVMSKSADSRVSITGSYKLYHALRDNGVKTQFIIYPGPGHLVTDPVRVQDVYERWLGWLEQYLDIHRRSQSS